MSKIHWISPLVFVIVATIVAGGANYAYAEKQTGDIGISFKGLVDPGFGVLDPENPKNELISEDEYGKTNGPLRIDFVPNINFSSNKIVKNDISYPVDSLLFKGIIAPKGNFIQISDYRDTQTGWSLQVRQETQFTKQDKEKHQLDGAVLSFDKSWVNTPNGIPKYPSVSKEVIRLNNLGETYTLAKAEKGTGGGTWSIIFGTSEDNPNDEKSTLVPRLDENGKPVIDNSKDNQAVYLNNAVRLTIPGRTKKEPGTYTTVLTWIISELP
ncbi:hypothetical protein A5821_002192 [Enterococcus sp. 7F3_DIV0205]|uniref:WxL domain-containing protein n=1 Tax=Candidatus Enterococcus palustris TaxID=1834189 RepID=A0AAQ3WBM5_9ENTE|nr:WxL domain-containing protein [Enterococcus sp. 7F3_DIV0205]OTN82631.1 hypothetical protein A5821_002542 [Enterococcus sp. 7F3_DIV0205]